MTIWDLENKILNSVSLSANQMRVVEEAIDSDDVSERVLACEALLRLGDEGAKEDAKRVLTQVVQDANSGRSELTSNLIMALFLLSEPVLDQPDFRTALTKAASHADESVRVNSMVALVPLVNAGRKWAEDLLRAGLTDLSQEVRQNARVGLDANAKAS